MSEIVEGLGASERERIPRAARRGPLLLDRPLRRRRRARAARKALDVPARDSCRPLLDFERGERPSRRFSASRRRSSSRSSATWRRRPTATARTRRPALDRGQRPRPRRLPAHRPPRAGLAAPLLPDYNAEGRSEQYIVYAVLDAMVATAFDALSDTELALEGLQTRTTETGPAAGADGNAAGDQPAADDDAAPARPAAWDLRADRRGDRPDREPQRRQRALLRARLPAAQPRRRRDRRGRRLDGAS